MKKLFITSGLLVAISFLAGCDQSYENVQEQPLPEEEVSFTDAVADDCNHSFLAVLPAKEDISEAQYSHTGCDFSGAYRVWEQNDLHISVNIQDAKPERLINADVGINKVVDQSNQLKLGMALFTVKTAKETYAGALSEPAILQVVGEKYLPLVIDLNHSDFGSAVALVSKEYGSDDLTAVIKERYIVTIKRSDSETLTDNIKAKLAYEPIIKSMNFSQLQ
jgi:hypothetical protein